MSEIATPEIQPPLFTRAGLDDLTDRELEILRCITNGLSNRQIVETLFISINTVKTYVRSIYGKIGAESRAHAIIWGVQHDLLAGREPPA